MIFSYLVFFKFLFLLLIIDVGFFFFILFGFCGYNMIIIFCMIVNIRIVLVLKRLLSVIVLLW